MTAAVELERAAVELGGRTVWRDVTLTVEPGSFTAVLGANGAGKSTLLRAILGLLPLAAGSARVLGGRPGTVNAAVGYLPQRRSLDAAAGIRGRDLVRLGLDGHRYGVPLPRLRRRPGLDPVADTIALVGAEAYADRPLGELSGGEQQRLLLAQALVRGPRLLLLDEPLDSLDLTNQAAVASLVRRICRDRGVAVVLVAHDVNPILGALDNVVYLAAGTAVTGSPAEVITSEALSALYGVPIEVLRARDGRVVVVGQPEAPFVHGHRHDR